MATNDGSRTRNSLASYKGYFEGNLLRCSNICTDSTMLVQEVSLTTTSVKELEIMGKNNSEAIQYISSTAFIANEHYNNLECTTQ